MIVALALHAFKKINFMGIGIQIDIYRDRLTDAQLGLFCNAAGMGMDDFRLHITF